MKNFKKMSEAALREALREYTAKRLAESEKAPSEKEREYARGLIGEMKIRGLK